MHRQLSCSPPTLLALGLLAMALLDALSGLLGAAQPLPGHAPPPPHLRPAQPAAHQPAPWPLQLPASTTRLTLASAPPVPAWCAGVRSAPTLTPAERSLAAHYYAEAAAQPGGGEVFEWGAGSSTLAAAAAGIARITSVDTVAGALACVLREGALGAGFVALHVEVHGEEGAFGNPVDAGARAAWPDVSSAILLHPQPSAIDVVLVDGRFRAASILKAASVLREDAVVLVHDWDTRPAYHGGVSAGLLRVVAQAERLVALQRTPAGSALTSAQWAAHWALVEYEQS